MAADRKLRTQAGIVGAAAASLAENYTGLPFDLPGERL
jgi:hypothetical protein